MSMPSRAARHIRILVLFALGALCFSLGRPVGADTSEVGGMGEFKAEKEQDLQRIRVGRERYEVPVVVFLVAEEAVFETEPGTFLANPGSEVQAFLQ